MKSEFILNELDKLYPEAKCELNYNKDYELLIATVLSAQSTDKRVNEVTKVLFSKYDIFSLCNIDLNTLESIIYPVGTYKKKAIFIKNIANSLASDYNGIVPNNRDYLENLPGVGRKTCNVVLSNIYNVPAIAVDTHVKRLSNRLGLSNSTDVSIIEKDLMRAFPKDKWSKLHHQLVLFGRYKCKSIKPECNNCPFISICNYNKVDKI
ncbi:endonuclease III [Clostridium sp. CAG:609]|nr:endonuclease III [Clostridium sp. CAG:609]